MSSRLLGDHLRHTTRILLDAPEAVGDSRLERDAAF